MLQAIISSSSLLPFGETSDTECMGNGLLPAGVTRNRKRPQGADGGRAGGRVDGRTGRRIGCWTGWQQADMDDVGDQDGGDAAQVD